MEGDRKWGSTQAQAHRTQKLVAEKDYSYSTLRGLAYSRSRVVISILVQYPPPDLPECHKIARGQSTFLNPQPAVKDVQQEFRLREQERRSAVGDINWGAQDAYARPRSSR